MHPRFRHPPLEAKSSWFLSCIVTDIRTHLSAAHKEASKESPVACSDKNLTRRVRLNQGVGLNLSLHTADLAAAPLTAVLNIGRRGSSTLSTPRGIFSTFGRANNANLPQQQPQPVWPCPRNTKSCMRRARCCRPDERFHPLPG